MKKILILSTIWGHESIARGVRDTLSITDNDINLQIIDVDPISKKSYNLVYRYAPSISKKIFDITKFNVIDKSLKKYFEISYYSQIHEFIKNYQPDVVISTYFAFDTSITKLLKMYPFKYINVVADPRSIVAMQIAKHGLNLVFDQKAADKAKGLVKGSKSEVSGWFVEKKYYQDNNRSRRTLTFCITGGSEGTFDVLKISKAVANTERRLKIYFMCGKNKQLYDLISSTKDTLLKNKKLMIKPIKYTTKMNLYFKNSDLIIGKAGPNTIFEAVASNTPFFAISHISGQEDGNLEIIKEHNLGFVEEDLQKANKLLEQIIKNPKMENPFKKTISNLSKYNQLKSKTILSLI